MQKPAPAIKGRAKAAAAQSPAIGQKQIKIMNKK